MWEEGGEGQRNGVAVGGRQGSGGSVRQKSLKMYLFTFLLWAGAKAVEGSLFYIPFGSRAPSLERVLSLHGGLARGQWLLHGSGCHLSPPLAWQSGPEEHDLLLGRVWGWWCDGDFGELTATHSRWWQPGSVCCLRVAKLGW